ncbi:dockerin type I repeat-containing protein [Patescibacteria group bacterium]|nr:dockerin type I repeat-containing protein [Patescibacteria group bacterium]MBU1952238.1 dockerin type I repeat-containing protein [Patescibacteria group bacterium]
MRSTKNASIIFGVFFVLLVFFVPEIGRAATVESTLNVSVSAIVQAPPPPEEPDTIVRFTGLAYPGSELTFEKNGTFLATVPADPAARFDVAIEMDPGTYTFSIYGEDVDGREGPVFNISVTLTSGVTVTITGIFLGPTIEADKSSVQVGDTITLLGITIPDSDVDLFISSETVTSYDTGSDNDGLWSQSLIAGKDLLTPGNHEARSKATSNGGEVSEFSKTVAFTVTDEEKPDPCEFATPGDLNCDGYVDLVDFSILMFYWEQSNPANERADINSDGIVDIIDFSIMMFYWTG